MPSPRISPCLWFDGQAEAAARFYCAIFPNSRITSLLPYGAAGEHNGKPADAILCVTFELAGQPFTALNGGPQFTFNEAISLQVPCRDQDEIDHYWHRLTEGGGQPGQCGWLKDKFGVSWQVFPETLMTRLAGPDTQAAARAMNAMMTMTKMDAGALDRAFRGQ